MGAGRTWHACRPVATACTASTSTSSVLFTGGPVRHMIDFAEYEATAGDLLDPARTGPPLLADERVRGTVLTMQPGFLPRATVEATGLTSSTCRPCSTATGRGSPGSRPPSTSCGASTRTPHPALSLHTAVLPTRCPRSCTVSRFARSGSAEAAPRRADTPGDTTFHALPGRGRAGLRHQPQRQRLRRRARLLRRTLVARCAPLPVSAPGFHRQTHSSWRPSAYSPTPTCRSAGSARRSASRTRRTSPSSSSLLDRAPAAFGRSCAECHARAPRGHDGGRACVEPLTRRGPGRRSAAVPQWCAGCGAARAVATSRAHRTARAPGTTASEP